MTNEQINNIDKENMQTLLKSFSEQWNEAIDLTNNLDLSIDTSKINNICLAGMGGSAIGADLIKSYSDAEIPIQVIRHYDIPNWVNENTLFITCSYSGNTEETLSAFGQAKEKGAQIIAVTSGGELLAQASHHGFDHIKIPGGLPPRAALGYSFIPLYRIFETLGFINVDEGALSDTADFLEKQGKLLTDTNESEAVALAESIFNTLPIIYSDTKFMQPVNLRWRCQIEENAKALAYGNVLPELNHNEIVGWENITHLTGRLTVIILTDDDDNENVKKRMNITEELINDHAASVHVLNTRGEHRLTRLFSLIQLSDWVSFYLAILNETDPTPVAKIDLLKRKLAEQ